MVSSHKIPQLTVATVLSGKTLTQYYRPNQSSSAESLSFLPEFSFGRILKLLKMSDHRYINSKNDPALFKWLQGGLKLGQDSELMTKNVWVLFVVDRSSINSFLPCLIYIQAQKLKMWKR